MAKTEFTIEVNLIPEALAMLEAKKRIILETVGGMAEGYAKELCPVGTEETTHIKGYKGGSLRSTIRTEVNGDEAEVKAGGKEGIYRYVSYATFVETGTIHMKAQPYLKPAFEDHLQEYKNVIETELGN